MTEHYYESAPDEIIRIGSSDDDSDRDSNKSGSNGSNGSQNKFSKEERRKLIQNLIKKNREKDGNNDKEENVFFNETSNKNLDNNTGDNSITPNWSSILEEKWSSDINHVDMRDISDIKYKSHSLYETSSSLNRENEINRTYRSQDDNSLPNSSRLNRAVQSEAAVKQEMYKEFTFKPQLNKSNVPSNSKSTPINKQTPFYSRVTKWQQESQTKTATKKKIVDNSEIQECTFHPKINKNSEKAVKELRGSENIEVTSDRLHKSFEIMYAQRIKFIEEDKQRGAENELRDCTFKPKLNNNKQYSDVKSKYEKTTTKIIDPKSDPIYVKQCPFTPTTNVLNPNMTSLKVYLSNNVVDRLTTRSNSSNDLSMMNTDKSISNINFGSRSTIDISSYLNPPGTYETPNGTRVRASSAPKERSNNTSNISNENKTNKFDQFFGRMSQNELKKERHLEELKKKTLPSFEPEFCPHSRLIAETHFKGEFLDRLDRDVIRRKDEEEKLNASITVKDSKCSFTPNILPKSSKLRSRSVKEMSDGDKLRRDHYQKLMKLRFEEEEKEHLTFHPNISYLAKKSGKSKMELNEEMMKKYQEKKMKREAKIQLEKKEREKLELESCTFAPKTKDCPQYVKRIAKSMTLVRAVRKEEENAKKSNVPVPRAKWV